VQTIEQNFIRTKLRGRVTNQEVFSFLERVRPNEKFDIIFADPPYDKMKSGGEYTRALLDHRGLAELLETSGVFVLEKRPEEELFKSELWDVTRAKTYGATEVLFLEHAGA
jgi:16S rRNA G966 N2-methylase RsmD